MKLNLPERPQITDSEVKEALDAAVRQVRMNLPEYTYRCQNHSSEKGIYPACDNTEWTTGFWPGEIWLSYEHTGDPVFLHAASILVESFLERIEKKIAVDHHDMGFLYTPSCVAAYKLSGNEHGRRAALLAADQLISRWQKKGQFLQAWGAFGAADNYRYIIDCLLNLPLLYWASDQTGNDEYREKAKKHTATCLKYSIRPDGSTFHTFFMNPETGGPDHGATCQGYRDNSDWARGQAWAVYGTALSYRYTHDPKSLEEFWRVSNFFLEKLPEDLIPYWDLIFTEGDEPRDSSSASIVACGMLEMAGLLEGEDAKECIRVARTLMKSLWEKYFTHTPAPGQGLVEHGTYSKKSPYNTCAPAGVDEYVSWGDYYYMEALTRLSKKWDPYW